MYPSTYVLSTTTYTRAPFRARINSSHFGADINILFSKLDENSILIYYFGAGQKNNPSHGLVAQVTMAPMSIRVRTYNYFCSQFNVNI